MRVGFLQFNPSFGNKKENFKTVENMLQDMSADVLLLPELFNTGYAFLNKNELGELAEPVEGETYRFIHNVVKSTKCAIAYGFAERSNDSYYNSMSLVAPSGLIATYRKSHLFFEEKFLFRPGDTGFNVFKYEDVKFGMMICWDWIYPEAMRTLALKGAQIVLQAANLVTPYCPNAVVTRAVENRVFIVTADRTGDETRDGKKYHFIGMSQVVAPNGEILVRVCEEPCVKIVDVDPVMALNKKMNVHNDLFADRRENLYFR
jgi:predicted amidohydrolase